MGRETSSGCYIKLARPRMPDGNALERIKLSANSVVSPDHLWSADTYNSAAMIAGSKLSAPRRPSRLRRCRLLGDANADLE